MSSPDSLENAVGLMATLDNEGKKVIQELLSQEAAASEFTSQMHKYTSMCWDKCITTPGNSFSRTETDCLQNCVNRFFDAQKHIIDSLLSDRKN
ncbi:hypothetical protein M422DRAFT_33248 [Sphaerobolus stellatus SS14]|uniref:Mitochondrial import inner membrane translocase subunit n=1 Tax=Sphaerobolus stellatus (strain SS14) TaxID=990650 RepID=A0A0C9VAA0_SPHS4|nr:hypothetical protein M422DRAFT_33248 [Sphaerobolus stellatus SS14]